MTDFPTLSYTWSLKKVHISGGTFLVWAIIGNTPPPPGSNCHYQWIAVLTVTVNHTRWFFFSTDQIPFRVKGLLRSLWKQAYCYHRNIDVPIVCTGPSPAGRKVYRVCVRMLFQMIFLGSTPILISCAPSELAGKWRLPSKSTLSASELISVRGRTCCFRRLESLKWIICLLRAKNRRKEKNNC